jgi:CMP-N,N'-diacetyllegionaminic acid synthase
MSVVALVPARAGSKRIPGKNVRVLGNHPLLAYTLAAAAASQVFDRVVVSTDSEEVARVARHYGAEVPFLRPAEFSGPQSPDIEWVSHALRELGDEYVGFSILRPTSPFRLPETIRMAHDRFVAAHHADSLRAVEPCRQHPAKMWTREGQWLRPLLPPDGDGTTPAHSRQYQSLPPVYAQNGSLELAWARTVRTHGSISGERILAFELPGAQGFDLNWPEDWYAAERMVELGAVQLPAVPQSPYVD